MEVLVGVWGRRLCLLCFCLLLEHAVKLQVRLMMWVVLLSHLPKTRQDECRKMPALFLVQ
jgi:hypothetical protein